MRRSICLGLLHLCLAGSAAATESLAGALQFLDWRHHPLFVRVSINQTLNADELVTAFTAPNGDSVLDWARNTPLEVRRLYPSGHFNRLIRKARSAAFVADRASRIPTYFTCIPNVGRLTVRIGYESHSAPISRRHGLQFVCEQLDPICDQSFIARTRAQLRDRPIKVQARQFPRHQTESSGVPVLQLQPASLAEFPFVWGSLEGTITPPAWLSQHSEDLRFYDPP